MKLTNKEKDLKRMVLGLVALRHKAGDVLGLCQTAQKNNEYISVCMDCGEIMGFKDALKEDTGLSHGLCKSCCNKRLEKINKK